MIAFALKRRAIRQAALVFVSCIGLSGLARAEAPVLVFAAASLTDALTAVGEAYQEERRGAMRFSFASSSTLARQIEYGAPAQLYVSAASQWVDYLTDLGHVVPNTRASLVTNRLVLIAPGSGAPNAVPNTAAVRASSVDMFEMLGSHGRLAMGDPGHVPAGIYAEEAFRTLGVWKRMRARVARADNVRGALALVARGEARLGVVYATDAALSADVRVVAEFASSHHAPIDYPVVLVKGAGVSARRAYAFLQSERAQAVFARFGFGAAGGTSP